MDSSNWSSRTEALSGLRMMPLFPPSPLKFRTVGFPQYGFKAGISDGPSLPRFCLSLLLACTIAWLVCIHPSHGRGVTSLSRSESGG